MDGRRARVSSPFSTFSSVYLYLIFFLVHILILHRNAQVGSPQTLDFDNPTVKDGDSVLHSPENLGQNSEKLDEKIKIYMYPEEDLDTSLVENYEDLMRIYAMERYFFKKLRNTGGLTDNPNEADLFFVPISCQRVKFWNATQAVVVARIANYFRSLMFNYPYWNRTFGADHFFMTCRHDLDLLNTGNTPSLAKNATQVIYYSTSNMKGFMPHEDILLPKAPLQLTCPLDEHELDDINTLEINNAHGFETIQFHNVDIQYCISDDDCPQARILDCIDNDSFLVIFSSNTEAAIHFQLLKILNHAVESPFSQT